MMEEYKKQINLKEIGEKGQEVICNARITVIGVGGLGSVILMYLARMGVGHLKIIDFDCVEVSNLARQILYNKEDVGKLKVLIAKKRMLDINAQIDIVEVAEKIDKDNISNLLDEYDIIVDVVDNMETRKIINQYAQKKNKIVVEGAVQGFEGTVMVIKPGSPLQFNKVYPDYEYEIQSDDGVLGSIVGTIGTIVVTETVKVILDIPSALSKKVLVFDGKNMDFRLVTIGEKSDA